MQYRIHHRIPGFTGRTVIACRGYDFTNGAATEDLNPTELVRVTGNGHRAEPIDGPKSITPIDRKQGRKMPAPEPEVGADVEVTEEAPPEIG